MLKGLWLILSTLTLTVLGVVLLMLFFALMSLATPFIVLVLLITLMLPLIPRAGLNARAWHYDTFRELLANGQLT
jgi:predicted neutral ceramidase superfamily lipid hydrolase